MKKICPVCRVEFETTNSNRVYCYEHKGIGSFLQSKEHLKNKRKEIIHHYSDGKMECACCSEKIFEFLTIDHIIAVTKSIEWKNRETNLLHMLKKNNFPKGIQILCFNCNYGKRNYNECPHKKHNVA